ncbi:unnamed protein product [Linum trigynum]|uniref:Uncharacterized protein n=1 Tax=Linum trigynum TaxID=586398 RepID=A0AAV2GBM5_9ROSI
MDSGVESTLKAYASDSNKLNRFDGTNFTRWQEKMKFVFTALKIMYIMDPDLVPLGEPQDTDSDELKAEQKKRSDDSLLCRVYILNSLFDRLYDLYSQLTTPMEIWTSLANQYKSEKQGANKFVTFQFFKFSMTDKRSILDQVHEFLILAPKFTALKITLPGAFLVGAIIAKLPPSWNNYRKKLLHTSEDFTLEQIQKHLRIEEETRIRDKDLNSEAPSSSKVNVVEIKGNTTLVGEEKCK